MKQALFSVTLFLFTTALFSQNPFITQWDTDQAGSLDDSTIIIPGTGTYYVSWEQLGGPNVGGPDTVTGHDTITFPAVGEYQVSITGNLTRVNFYSVASETAWKITSVEQWGDIAWTSMDNAFAHCYNLVINDVNTPDLSGLTTMYAMFSNCASLTGDLSAWDISGVTNTAAMFFNSPFNGSLNNWNTEMVTNMDSMFYEADAFNQSLNSWDVSSVTSMHAMFYNATAFNGNISNWDVSSVTKMSSMFWGASSFNANISSWTLTSVSTLLNMFYDANAFNQDLGTWDVSGISNLSNFFHNTGLSTENYDNTLIGWAAQSVQSGVSLGSSGLTYCDTVNGRDILKNTYGWTIYSDVPNCPPQDNSFVTIWQTDNPGGTSDTQIEIPATGNYYISWEEDGNPVNNGTQVGSGATTITFPSAGTYYVSITGDITRIEFNNGGDKEKLVTIEQWGDIAWSSMENAFFGCAEVVYLATDAPDLSSVTSARKMFQLCSMLDVFGDPDLSTWDMSGVQNTSYMFSQIPNLNANIDSWVVSGVTDMNHMFNSCTNFNRDLSAWDVSAVTNMENMFVNCTAFNGNITTWTPLALANAKGMFKEATSFNQNIGSWNVSQLTDATEMFYNAQVFNQDIGTWNTSSITKMEGIFYSAAQFNQDLNNWDVSNVTNMISVFEFCDNFNGNVSLWNVSNVTDMTAIFKDANVFNQDVSAWNTASVQGFSQAFQDAPVFNQDLSAWNTISATCMSGMFLDADSFNQNLGAWDVTGISSPVCLNSMLSNSNLSLENYDNTLIGWSGQSVNSGIGLGAIGLAYCAGEAARDLLINTHGWTFGGDTLDCTEICSSFGLAINVTNETYPSASDGTATANPTGGLAPYSYLWNDPVNQTSHLTQSITGLAPATYDVTVTDANSCQLFDAAVVLPGSCSFAILSMSSTSETSQGANDGSATATMDQSGTYTYNWSNGSNSTQGATHTISNLSPDTFTVTVTHNASACQYIDSVVVTPFDTCGSFSGTIVASHESAPGANDGKVVAEVNGGGAPYDFTWSTGDTYFGGNIDSIMPLMPAWYKVTVSHASNNCEYIDSAEVLAYVDTCNGFALSVGATNETSPGANDGTATATPSGGTSPYTYAWSNGGNTMMITGLAPDTFIVTVTDNIGCELIDSAEVLEASDPCAGFSSTISSSNETCYGSSDGTATVTPVLGNPNFSYLWSDGQTSQTATGLTSGTYNVTITDDSACTTLNAAVITSPAELFANTSATDESSPGANDGTATANPSGGTSPYTYLWSNGQTTSQITGLSPATYYVTVTDLNNCTVIDSAEVLAAGDACAGFASTMSSTNETCYGSSDGTATVTPVLGNPNFSYLWSDGQTSQTAIGLTAGTYTVTITDDSSCTTINAAVITSPAELLANTSATGESTPGANDGTATANPSGGTIPYIYLWDNGETTQAITGLAPATYLLTLTDANGCQVIDSAVVNPASPSCNGFITSVGTVDESSVGANDGIGIANASGGTSPYDYSWSTGEFSSIIIGLSPGNYSVTISDANGCTESHNFTINAFSCPNIIIAMSATDETSLDAEDGTATANPSGGISPYSYAWNNGGTTSTITGLAPMMYVVTVTDSSGCSSIDIVEVLEYTCDSFAVAMSATDETSAGANDGTATATPSGGISPYTYLWSNGGTTQSITGLIPDDYTVTVTETGGCTEEGVVSVQPFNCSGFTVSVATTDESSQGANDGTATGTPSGGASPYTYLWDNGGTTQAITNLSPGVYILTVTDASGCTATDQGEVNEGDPNDPCDGFSVSVNTTDETSAGANDGTADALTVGGTSPFTYLWSNGGTTQAITNLAPNTYMVTVVDANNCIENGSGTVNPFNCNLNLAMSSTNESAPGAADGTATATATDGTTPYAYLWSNGQSTSVITGLVAGTYEVTVTDATNCVQQGTVVVDQDSAVNPCGNFTVSTGVTHETAQGANDGTATATPSGGSLPYAYSWSNGAGNVSMITGLAPGVYIVRINDANFCSIQDTVTVLPYDSVQTLCNLFTVSASATDETYLGANDGTATVSTTNGTAPFSYLWSNGSSTQSISSLPPNTYTVTVTDALGCEKIDSAQVNQGPDPCIGFSVSASATDETYLGANDGTATVSTTNGTAPYTYAWSTGASTQNINNLAPGTYSITVQDANGCTGIDSTEVNIGPDPCVGFSVVVIATDETTQGANDGTASAGISSGTSPFVYVWSSGESTAGIDSLAPGTYMVTVTDANGCIQSSSATVNPGLIDTCGSFSLSTSSTNETLQGENDGTASVMVSGGQAPFVYDWSNGATTDSINGLSPGIYYITVVDSNSCSLTDSVEVAPGDTLVDPCANFSLSVTATDQTAQGIDDGTATAMVTGGTMSYSYLWSNGDTTSVIDSLAPGTYTVTVTDSNGCELDDIVNVQSFSCSGFSATVTPTDESAAGANDGEVNANVSGGTMPYSYLWNTADTTQNITGLAPATYTVTVTDSSGCTASAQGVVNPGVDPCANFSIVVSGTDETSVGVNDGTASVSVTGGSSPYGYLWTNGEITQAISGLSPDTYSVTVTDANNCSLVDSVVVNPAVADPCTTLTVQMSGNDESAQGASDGSANAIPTGGVSPIQYAWSNGATTPGLVGLSPGTYSVTVTDADGCTASDSIVVLPGEAVGIWGVTTFGNISLYPNPTEGHTILKIEDHNRAFEAQLRVVNLLGETVIDYGKQNIVTGYTKELNLGALPSGYYLLEITGNKLLKSVPFVLR